MPSRWSRSLRCVQSFTYIFALERAPAGEDHLHPPAREVRALPGLPAVQPHDRGPRRRDLRRGERLARLPACSSRRPARRARCGPTAGWSTRRRFPAPRHATSRCSTGRETTTATRASSTLPRERRSGAAGRKARQPRLPALAADRGARRGRSSGAPELRLRPDVMGSRRRPVEAPVHSRGAADPCSPDGGRARRVGGVPARPASGPLPGLGGPRLVPDRHPPFRPGGCRRQHAHPPLPDPARSSDPDRADERRRRLEERRHDAHHERVLPPAPGGVEHRRGRRSAGRLVASPASDAVADLA